MYLMCCMIVRGVVGVYKETVLIRIEVICTWEDGKDY